MKKLILGLTASIFLGIFGYSQSSVSFYDIKGKEMAIIIDNIDGHFKEYYLFQYNSGDFAKFNDIRLSGEIKFDNQSLIIKSKEGVYSFSVSADTSFKNNYYGYGLSRRVGLFTFSPIEDPVAIYDVIPGVSDPIVNGKKLDCHSGGPGAEECSVKPSDINVGAPECSVKCGKGYYACCDDTRGECRCLELKK